MTSTRFVAVALSCIALTAVAGPKKGSRKKAAPPLAEIAGNEEALCCTDGALKNPDELEEAR